MGRPDITVASELVVPYEIHYTMALESAGLHSYVIMESEVEFRVVRGGTDLAVSFRENLRSSGQTQVDKAVEGDWAGSFLLEPGYDYVAILSAGVAADVYGTPDAGGLTWAAALTWIGLFILERAKFAH